jgi:hypothetical protein
MPGREGHINGGCIIDRSIRKRVRKMLRVANEAEVNDLL